MPRVKPSQVALARWLNPLLGKLMGVARTRKAADAELRWMEEVILRLDERDTARLARRYRIPFQPVPMKTSRAQRIKWGRKLIQKFVEERSHGMPFAHVVENQPFGHLMMHVRPGVFVPRWETEEWAIALASRLRKLPPSRQAFTLVDLCSGSGCIPILLKNFVSANIDKALYPKYGKPNDLAKFIGIEQSPTAIKAARINLERSQLPDQKYSDNDIRHLPAASFQGRVDIITSNPPYVPLITRHRVERCVTKYEPPEAVFAPSLTGDDYYYLLRAIANRWGTSAIIMEVGHLNQVGRVKSLFDSDDQWKTSVWLDSAGEGRVVVAVKSEKWSFLLPQPNYSVPVDLSPIPRQEVTLTGDRGSILSTFIPPDLVERPPRPKRQMEDTPKLNFVERLIEKLRPKGDNEHRQSESFRKYSEDFKKISK